MKIGTVMHIGPTPQRFVIFANLMWRRAACITTRTELSRLQPEIRTLAFSHKLRLTAVNATRRLRSRQSLVTQKDRRTNSLSSRLMN